MSPSPTPLVRAARRLSEVVESFRFSGPVHTVYNPLVYARRSHERFLTRFGRGRKRVLMMGMNPGPWGMAQTGVPFGEIAHVRDWMGIDEPVDRPDPEHPKRPITGFDCERSEVSGRRLWGLFAGRYPDPADFFREHWVTNYCPLVFMGDTGRNITPDKLPVAEREPLEAACSEHLEAVLDAVRPEVLVGVGAYAESKLGSFAEARGLPLMRLLHPSPASPLANRDWAGTASRQLVEAGIWAS